MKFYHVISLSTAGLLSLGALGFMAQTKHVEFNQDFRMETLTGNVSALNGVVLENIAKVNQTSYAQVTLNGEHATVTPTVYDAYHGVTEEQLENRELYRNVHSPVTFENDDYLITVEFDYQFPYSSSVPTARVAVKNKHTNKITVENPVLNEFSAQEYSNSEYITESNGTYYYVLTTFGRNNNNSRALVYTFNPDTLKFEFKFEAPFDSYGSACLDNFLYTVASPSDSNQTESEFISLNLETEELTTQPLGKQLYADSILKLNDDIFIVSESKLYQYNPSVSPLLNELPSPSFIEKLETYDYYYVNQTLATNNLIYLTYQTYNQGSIHQFISVVDPTTQKVVYEGQINIRSDQGLSNTYKLKLS